MSRYWGTLTRLAAAITVVVGATVVAAGTASASNGSTGTPAPPPEPEEIIGGTDVSPSDKYPFTVALVDLADNQFCGGSLIAPTWVVTAAHCVTAPGGAQDVFPAQVDAVIGRPDLTTTTGEQLDVVTIVIHPNWSLPNNATSLDDDIALLELATPATVGGVVQLAQSVDAPLWADGLTATVIGWGATNPNGTAASTTLQEVDVPFKDDSVCTGVWGAPPAYTPATDVCAGGDVGLDSCSGDSGGPIIAPNGTNPVKLVGIVSGGAFPCAQAGIPAIYTEIAAYSSWIQTTAGLDVAAPTVTIEQQAGDPDPTSATTVNFTAVFSEPVTGFATGDVTLGGTAGATTAVVTELGVPGSGTNYAVAVSGFTSDGTVIASVGAGVAADAALNLNTDSTSLDNVITVDLTAPTVTIEQAAGQLDPTAGASINFTAVFSEAVTGFDNGDVTLSGSAAATTVAVAGSGMTYDIVVSGMTAEGVVAVDVNAGVASDAVGNANTASTSSDNQVTSDVVPPAITTPGTLTVNNDPGSNGAAVTYVVTATDGGVTTAALTAPSQSLVAAGGLTCAPASGAVFPIGATTVSCAATDLLGNASAATFAVVVVDNEAPALADPGTLTATISAAPTGALTYALPASSDNSGALSVVCTPPPGTMVGVGTTMVTCTATDVAGNATVVSFDIIVVAPVLPATGGGLGALRSAAWVVLVGLALLGVSRRGQRRRVTWVAPRA